MLCINFNYFIQNCAKKLYTNFFRPMQVGGVGLKIEIGKQFLHNFNFITKYIKKPQSYSHVK